MKQKERHAETKEDTSPQQIPRSSGSNKTRANDDTKTKEDSAKRRNIEDRPRKSYHHDGPGGGYTGY